MNKEQFAKDYGESWIGGSIFAFPLESEGNRLIAEFMGKNYHPKLEATSIINNLYYHISWDWLMPVIEKISKITIEWENSHDRTETYYPVTFGMLNSETRKAMVRINGNTLHEADTLMEATYLAVVDFIKWYKGWGEKNRIMMATKEMEESLRKAYEDNERNRKNSVRYPNGK